MAINQIVISTGPYTGNMVQHIGSKSIWHNIDNILIDDNTFSQILLSQNAETNGFLLITAPFVASDIPDDAIILNIAVQINIHSNTTRSFEDVYWSFMGIQTTNIEPGTTKNKANFVTVIPTNQESLSYTVATYSPLDWGFTYMVGSDITNKDFGLVIQLRSSNAPASAFIDYISFIATWVKL